MVWVVAVTVMVIPFTQQQITTVMVVKVVPGRSERMDHGGGNLFWGIDNCSCATRSVVKVRYKALDNSFSNVVSLF